jgi:hypothetical protein
MARHGPIVTRSLSVSASPRAVTRNAPVLPPVATSRPTPQFSHHHDVTAPQVDANAFRQGWRIVSRLDGLLEAGRIGREGRDVALQWRGWAETVTPYRAQSWAARVDISAVPNDAGMLRRVAAASRLRAAAETLGELRIRLLEACVLRDRSWREIANLLRVSDKTALSFTAEAINALADWDAGRSVTSPPVLRFRNQPGSL